MFLGDCITQQQFTISNNQRLIQLATQIRESKCSTAEQEEGWLPLQGHCIIDNVWLYPLYYSKIVPSILFKNCTLYSIQKCRPFKSLAKGRRRGILHVPWVVAACWLASAPAEQPPAAAASSPAVFKWMSQNEIQICTTVHRSPFIHACRPREIAREIPREMPEK